MKDVVKYAKMLDIYGGLLTEKQYDILDSYYARDLTLEEIAENHGISRQAVHFAVKSATEKIESFEESLSIMAKYDALEESITNARDKALSGETGADEIAKMLTEILNKF